MKKSSSVVSVVQQVSPEGGSPRSGFKDPYETSVELNIGSDVVAGDEDGPPDYGDIWVCGCYDPQDSLCVKILKTPIYCCVAPFYLMYLCWQELMDLCELCCDKCDDVCHMVFERCVEPCCEGIGACMAGLGRAIWSCLAPVRYCYNTCIVPVLARAWAGLCVVGRALGQCCAAIGRCVSAVVQKIASVLSACCSAIGRVLVILLTPLCNCLATCMSGIATGMGKARDFLVKILSPLFNCLRECCSAIWGFLAAVFGKIWGVIRAFTAAINEAIVQPISRAAHAVMASIRRMF